MRSDAHIEKPSDLGLSDILWQGLFPHQREAVDLISRYLSRELVPRPRNRNRQKSQGGVEAGLVRMPTGSGKSGIIAVVAQCLPAARSCLIVSPSDAICDQLIQDVQVGFWQTLLNGVRALRSEMEVADSVLEVESIKGAKSVLRLLRSNREKCLRAMRRGPVIFVSTIQALLDIFDESRGFYDSVQNTIDLALVDEGPGDHQEINQSGAFCHAIA
jgi:hypothetical protein